MKGIVTLGLLPVAIFVGLVLAVVDLSDSKLQSYEKRFQQSAMTRFLQTVAVLGVGGLVVGGVFMMQKRKLDDRPRRSRSRRRRSRTRDVYGARLVTAPVTPIEKLVRGVREPAPMTAVITPAPPRAGHPFATPPAPPAPPSPVAGMSITAHARKVEAPAPAVEAPMVETPAKAAPSKLDMLMPTIDEPAPAKIEAPSRIDMLRPTIDEPAPRIVAVPAPPVVAPVVVPIAPVVEKAEAPLVPRPVVSPISPAPRPSSDPLSHWGLREPAFDNAPSTRFFYLSPEHAEALFRLRYAIQHRKGCAALIGRLGCGKTTLTRALVRELDPERFDVALLASPMETPVAFLRELLFQLGITLQGDDKPSLWRALEVRLLENLRRNRDTVVIVDEAQTIESEELFNELRLLLNFQTNDRFLITLVLSGSSELIKTLRSQPQLAQRCAVRASLEPLDRQETGNYVRHRLVTAGRAAETLTEEAVDEVYAATGGTPRRINAVCDLSLFAGASAGVARVEADLVRKIAADGVLAA